MKLRTIITASLLITSTLALSGCAGRVYGEVNRQKTNEDGSVDRVVVGAEGTWGDQTMLRTISEMIASLTGFSISDWNELDVSEYEIELDASFGTIATIEGNVATVSVFSSESIIGTQEFAVTQIGNKAKFSDPVAVKNWTYQFVDIADNVEVDIKTKSVNMTSQPADVQVKVRGGNLNIDAHIRVPANSNCYTSPNHEADRMEICPLN